MTPNFFNTIEATIPKEASHIATRLLGDGQIDDGSHDKNLTSALMALSKFLGRDFFIPEEIEADILKTLDMVALKSGLRYQKLPLHGQEWWLKDLGPLLVFDSHEDRYLTLIPQSSGGYNVHDQPNLAIDENFAAHLGNTAFVFFLPFPEEKTSLWEVFKLSLNPTKREIISVFCSQFLIAILGLLSPVFFGMIVDYAINLSDRGMLGQIICGLMAATVCGIILNILQAIAILRLKLISSSFVQAALWDRLVRLPLSFYRLFGVGELIERAYGLNTVYQQINANLLKSALSLLWGSLSILLIFYYNARIGWIVLLTVLILLGLSIASLYLQTIYFNKMTVHDGRSSNLFLQMINALKKIRSAHKEEIFFKKWVHHTESRLYFFFKAHILSIITGSFQSYFTLLLTMMIYISFMAGETAATLSTFIIINGLIGNFIASFSALTSVVGNYLYLLPLYKRIKPVLETEPEKATSAYQDELEFKEIVFEKVSFSYDIQSKKPTLSKISLKIPQGQFIAIVGASGSGKTTLLRLLLGLEIPQSGKILIDNIDSSYLSYDALRQQCGVVLQSTDLIPGTILENITGFASDVSHDQVLNVLKATNLTAEIDELPMGLQTLVLEQGQSFSLGQRQRILIARALYHAPRMLILDEATSALDNMSQKIIYDNLAKLSITRFVIAHRLSTIKQADYIYVIEQGEVVEEGSFAELMTQSGPFFRLVNKQT